MQNNKSTSTTATDKAIEDLGALSINDRPEQLKELAAQRIQSALNFIDAVKERFLEEQPQVYNDFLDILKDYHNQR